jgi:hypothetical protein
MNLNKRLVLAIAVALIALIVGCSGSNPTSPEGTNAGSIDGLPVIGLSTAGDTFNAIGILGAYDVRVNAEEMTAELVSKRFSTIGESLLVSGLGFFSVRPCGNCVQITGVEKTPEGLVKLTYHVKHPFNVGDPGLPPKGNNRADLDIFDMAFVINDSNDVGKVLPLLMKKVRPFTYVNPDGYSKELEKIVKHTDALPYYLVVDDSVTGTSTWNEFPMGGEGDAEIFIKNQGAVMNFEMYLTFGYGAAARKATFFEPRYFNPEFNRKNAWKIEVTPPWGTDNPTWENAWTPTDTTTLRPITVKVYDWQQGANVYAGTDFEGEALLSDVYKASNVASVKMEIPGATISQNMFNLEKTMLVADSGTGMPGNPLVYTFNVANENQLPAGSYTGFVQVLDERDPASIPTVRDYLIDSPDGAAQTPYIMTEYATYQSFPVFVLTPCGPIGGTVNTVGPLTTPSGGLLDFSVSGVSGNGGSVVLYEIDWNYDGTTFVPRATSTTGLFEDVGPFVADNCPTEPVFTVAFRLTDDCEDFLGNPNVLVLSDTVTVNALCCAIEDINVWNFDACGGGTELDTCDGWQTGTAMSGLGCALPNADSWSYGMFTWGCIASVSCGDISGGYVTSGSDSGICAYGWMTDYGAYADYNIVSSDINMPSMASYDFVNFEFEHCNAFCTTGFFNVYYHAGTGCPASITDWVLIHQDGSAEQSDCMVTKLNIDALATGGVGRFRLQFTDPSSSGCGGGSCGNTGVIIDNIKITGCAAL